MRDWKEILELVGTGPGPFALASIVRTTGSSYRQVGARFVVDASGRRAGALSSGCLEDEVAQLGLKVLREGTPQLVSFDLRPRFGCTGAIEVWIEVLPFDSPVWASIREVRAKREPVELVTAFEGPHPSGTRVGSGPGFGQTIEAPVQLLLLGDSEDNRALERQAKLLGWDVRVAEQIPLDWKPDARTAVVVKAHKFGRDFLSLKDLLALSVPYVGLVGPHRRKQQLLNQLIEEGAWSPEKPLPHLYGPSGLDLGGETSEEIALAIVAEIQAVLHGRAGGFLRHKKSGIHDRA
jgi:xanthine/CO dehydrogenase XdhC/CoxF family maturation factor